ncbi:MAG: cob(I)yrinic acid a,c-diamide adenosyltransferase [Thermoplasmata archaeon]|nr:cob(I)yrinic acid a,c-diamide adenosyltransferase [Thermoplasmata archaeon]
MTGLIHVYTGNGKGKTTAALGLCLRALGRGYTVHFIQFMKGSPDYGEIKAAKAFKDLHIKQFGRAGFVDKAHPTEADVRLAQEGLDHAGKVMESLPADGREVLMVLDELNVALEFGLLSMDQVLALIRHKPKELELVITGRNAPPWIIEVADYATEMREIMHPFTKGIKARKGIEF